MASIIKSDNGVSSGITGIFQSADSSGQLVLQTTTSSGTATTAVTIDNTQKVTFANSIGFGSNAGITFNNSSALTNSTLNDYETGTFTPSPTAIINCSAISVTNAIYTKIGRNVYCEITGTLTVTTTGAIYFTFTAPFSSALNLCGTYGSFVCGSGYGITIDNSGSTTNIFGAQTLTSPSAGTNLSFVLGLGYTTSF